MKEITSKQFGDACEMHVIAELMFAGRPAVKMPNGWRGYDIIAETDDGPIRISVERHTRVNQLGCFLGMKAGCH